MQTGRNGRKESGEVGEVEVGVTREKSWPRAADTKSPLSSLSLSLPPFSPWAAACPKGGGPTTSSRPGWCVDPERDEREGRIRRAAAARGGSFRPPLSCPSPSPQERLGFGKTLAPPLKPDAPDRLPRSLRNMLAAKVKEKGRGEKGRGDEQRMGPRPSPLQPSLLAARLSPPSHSLHPLSHFPLRPPSRPPPTARSKPGRNRWVERRLLPRRARPARLPRLPLHQSLQPPPHQRRRRSHHPPLQQPSRPPSPPAALRNESGPKPGSRARPPRNGAAPGAGCRRTRRRKRCARLGARPPLASAWTRRCRRT